jgi:hypothetical protein
MHKGRGELGRMARKVRKDSIICLKLTHYDTRDVSASAKRSKNQVQSTTAILTQLLGHTCTHHTDRTAWAPGLGLNMPPHPQPSPEAGHSANKHGHSHSSPPLTRQQRQPHSLAASPVCRGPEWHHPQSHSATLSYTQSQPGLCTSVQTPSPAKHAPAAPSPLTGCNVRVCAPCHVSCVVPSVDTIYWRDRGLSPSKHCSL